MIFSPKVIRWRLSDLPGSQILPKIHQDKNHQSSLSQDESEYRIPIKGSNSLRIFRFNVSNSESRNSDLFQEKSCIY